MLWRLELLVSRFNDGTTLVITAFRAYDVRWHGGAALRAVRHLTLFQVIVGAAFAGAAIGVLAFWDGHGRQARERAILEWVEWTNFKPRKISTR
ncbi:MAG: hypothetical protein Rhob2KO_07590 [Rhodopirellula baltica]